MADTIFQNFAQGYQTGIEMGTAQEKDQAQTTIQKEQAKQAPSQTSLLSTQADQAKFRYGQERDAAIAHLATRSSLLNAQKMQGDKFKGDAQSQLQAAQMALKQEENPAVREELGGVIKSLVTEVKGQAQMDMELQKQQGSVRSQAFSTYAGVKDWDGMIKSGQDNQDPMLVEYGQKLKAAFATPGMSDKAKEQLVQAAEMSLATPESKYLSQIAAIKKANEYRDIQDRKQDEVNKKDNTAAALKREGFISAEKIAEIRAKGMRDAAALRQANKDAKAATLEKKRVDTRVKFDTEIRKIDDEQAAIRLASGIANVDKGKEGYYLGFIKHSTQLSDVQKKRYQELEAQKSTVKDTFSKNMKDLKDPIKEDEKNKPTANFTKETPAMIDPKSSEAEQKSAYDALDSGDWFVNPADGELLQKP
jgi:hypothetical protein